MMDDRMTIKLGNGRYAQNFTTGDGFYTSFSDMMQKLGRLEDMQEAGRMIELPCKIGDTVYGIRRYQGVRKVQSGVVSEMYFSQKNRLIIVIKHICRGYWGENIFGSLEEAEAALKERG